MLMTKLLSKHQLLSGNIEDNRQMIFISTRGLEVIQLPPKKYPPPLNTGIFPT
jgi:hypothetical protein